MQAALKKGVTFGLIASVLNAFFMVPWKIASGLGSPRDMVFLLVLVAAIQNLVAYVVSQGWRSLLERPSRLEFLLAAALGFLTIMGNQCSAMSVTLISPAIVTTLLRAEVVFVSLLGWLILKERVPWNFWLGFAFVVLGMWLMQPVTDLGGDWLKGGGYAALGALAFALMGVLTRKYIHEINLTKINGLRLWFALVAWMLMYMQLPSIEQVSWKFAGLIMLAALLGPTLARYCLMVSMKYVEARTTALVISSAPVWALFFAWMILGDLPSKQEIQGGLVMLVGVSLAIFDFKYLIVKLQNTVAKS